MSGWKVMVVHSGDGLHVFRRPSEDEARAFMQRSTSAMLTDGWRATFAGTDCVALRRDLQSVVLLVTQAEPADQEVGP